jgi:hypothetical protein
MMRRVKIIIKSIFMVILIAIGAVLLALIFPVLWVFYGFFLLMFLWSLEPKE